MAAFEYTRLDEFYRVMCWSHVERNCEEWMRSIEHETREKLLQDIRNLQIMPNTRAFNHGVKLFFDKWKGNEEVVKFLDHFKEFWIDKNNGWYEGFADGHIPSTDNGLESVNRVIKEQHTLRERLPVGEYMKNAFDMFRDWSIDRFPNEGKQAEKPFSDAPKITKQTWTLAYDFLYKDGKALVQQSKETFILTKTENKSFINLNYVHGRYHLLKGSFDDFVKYFSIVRLIKLNKENWLLSTCNCSWFLKNYYCYHLIAIASNSGLIVIPIEYKDLAIGHKPIRGRKRLAKSALEKNLD